MPQNRRTAPGDDLDAHQQTVDAVELARRELISRAVEHETVLAGGTRTQAGKEDFADYVAGLIDSDELVERAQKRIGIGGLEEATALIVKSQQLAGHFPTDEDVKLGTQVYLGEQDGDQVVNEIIEQERED